MEKYVLHFDLTKTLVEYLTKFKEGLPSNIISLSQLQASLARPIKDKVLGASDITASLYCNGKAA